MFSLVLQGCPRRVLFLHVFYKVVQSCPRKMVVFSFVLQGRPRKVLFLHWFYKVVQGKCCFYIGFAKVVVHEKPYKTLAKSTFLADNPPGTVWGQKKKKEEEKKKEVKLPHNSPSCTIVSLISRSLARTNETKRFPGWRFHKLTHLPNLQ